MPTEVQVRGQASPRAPGQARASAFVLALVAVLALVGVLGPGGSDSVSMPPFLAYALGPGAHWLLVLAGAAAVASAAKPGGPLAGAAARVAGFVERRPATAWIALAALAVVAFARVPDVRWSLQNIGGDEPQYLRIAESLVNDTDNDLSSGRQVPPDLSLRLRQVRSLALTARDAVVGLGRPAAPPEGHQWNAGNWAVRGRHGGVYALQPPGLPALLAVFIGAGQAVAPEFTAARLATLFLVLVWILGGVETYKLAAEVLESRPAALLATGSLLCCAPVLVGGYHLYPESVAFFLFPFCYRRLRVGAGALRPATVIAAGAVAGGLWWLHPKFVAASLVLLAIGLLRPRVAPPTRALLGLSFLVPVASSLVYVHYVTGLFRPEGLYIRQAQEYVGVPSILSWAYAQGLANGILGATDGLFVWAPLLLLGVAALPVTIGPYRRTTLELLALFGAVWATAATHGGVSLGSPARLFVPVAFAPMLTLALAARAWGPRARIVVPVLLLAAVSVAVTVRASSHWRLALNPYRGLFMSPAHDFRRSLPLGGPGATAPVADVARAALLIGAALATGLRWRSGRGAGTDTDTAPVVEATGMAGAVAALAFALDAAGDWLVRGVP